MGRLPIDYLGVIGRFIIERTWDEMPEGDKTRWGNIVELWASEVRKGATYREAVLARLKSGTIKAFSKILGVSYGIAYQNLQHKVREFETHAPELGQLFIEREKRLKLVKDWRAIKPEMVKAETWEPEDERRLEYRPIGEEILFRYRRPKADFMEGTNFEPEKATRLEEEALAEFFEWLPEEYRGMFEAEKLREASRRFILWLTAEGHGRTFGVRHSDSQMNG